MERKEESGRWGSMSISPYMSVIKTTKRLVIHFYSGRIFDLFEFDRYPFKMPILLELRSGIVSCFPCHSHSSALCNVRHVDLDITKR